MATFLELAQDLARESGSMDWRALTSVTDQRGRPEKIVGWVRKAYVNIQNSRRDWGWLVSDFSMPLVPGTPIYTPASFNLTRFGSWVGDRDWYMPLSLYDPIRGISDEHEIRQVTYEYWRSRYGRGDQTVGQWNRPTEFAITPQNEIAFGALPDRAYVIRGQYVKGPQVLAANTEVPEMPARFHDMIVWEAHRLLMLHDGAFNEAQYPSMELTRLRHELEVDQLPEITVP